MRRSKRKKSSGDDFPEAILTGRDPDGFAIRFIDNEIGSGVFAEKIFAKGSFLLEYKGDLISGKEGAIRERTLPEKLGSFLYFFTFRGKQLCIDATLDPFALCAARIVNDDHNTPNAVMKIKVVHDTPHLCLFATRQILMGEEIRFDYGVADLPWRKQTLKRKPQSTLSLGDLTFCGLNKVAIAECIALNYSMAGDNVLTGPTDLQKGRTAHRETLLRQLAVNTKDLESTLEELDIHKESEEQNYDIFIDNLCNKRRQQQDKLSPVQPANGEAPTEASTNQEAQQNGPSNPPTAPSSLSASTSVTSNLSVGSPVSANQSPAQSPQSPAPPSSTPTPQEEKKGFLSRLFGSKDKNTPPKSPSASAETMVTSPSSEPGENFNSVDDFVPEGEELDASFLEDTKDTGKRRQRKDTTDTTDSDEDEDGGNPMVAGFQDEIDSDDDTMTKSLSSGVLSAPAQENGASLKKVELSSDEEVEIASGAPVIAVEEDLDSDAESDLKNAKPTKMADAPSKAVTNTFSKISPHHAGDGDHNGKTKPGLISKRNMASVHRSDSSQSTSSQEAEPVVIVTKPDLDEDKHRTPKPPETANSETVTKTPETNSSKNSSKNGAVAKKAAVTLEDSDDSDDGGVVSDNEDTKDPGDTKERGDSSVKEDLAMAPDFSNWLDAQEAQIKKYDCNGSEVDGFDPEKTVQELQQGSLILQELDATDIIFSSDISETDNPRPNEEVEFPQLSKPCENEDVILNDDDGQNEESIIPNSSELNHMSDKVYFQDYPKVYYRKTEKCEIGKKGQIKKLERVFKTKHACLVCGVLYAKIHEHIFSQHPEDEDVKSTQKELDSLDKGDLPDKEKKAERNKHLTLIRNKGDHKYNMGVLKQKHGELILGRRPPGDGPFLLSSYKPCPNCFMWVTDLAKHCSYSNRCLMKTSKLSKRQAELRSNVTTGNCIHGASRLLQDTVLSRMSEKDPISRVVIGDQLILKLGEDSLQKNVRNPLKRAQYASCKMRLPARLLQLIREEKGKPQMSINDCLLPHMYPEVVKAVVKLSGGNDSSFIHPSNALKLGYTLKELCDIKYTTALIKKDKEAADDANIFQQLCEKNWSKDVSSLAIAVIAEKKFNKVVELPLPTDLKQLSSYLQKEAQQITQISSDADYKKAVEIAQSRLLTYNKRRPGELEALQIEMYKKRPQKEHHMAEYLNSLSPLEKKLLESQEVVTVRGKHGRPVPILIPLDIYPLTELLQQDEVRKRVGVQHSPYLFASLNNPLETVFRAGDSLNTCVEAAQLDRPELVKSTNLRKYMATTIQVLSLNTMQMEWVADHLGHSLDVEKTYYRIASTTIERAKVAKLLILADEGKLDQYKGKNLDELQFDDIILKDDDNDEEEEEIKSSAAQDNCSRKGKRKADDCSTKQGIGKRARIEDESDPEWCFEVDATTEKKMKKTEWTADTRKAYKEVFEPVVVAKGRMLKKAEIDNLKKKHPLLSNFSHLKLKNKLNADIQRIKRQKH